MTIGRVDGEKTPRRLACPLSETGLYPTLVLALRDMRTANGRDATTGDGDGNASWIGLSLAMIVLDTLTGRRTLVGRRWHDLLSRHGVSYDDAKVVYALRCSLLHGYGLPKLSETGGRKVLLSADRHACALDTSTHGEALLSIPVFCGELVERIAYEAPRDWDVSEINTDYPYLAAAPSTTWSGL